MHAKPHSRTIGLIQVAKSFSIKGRAPVVVFRPTTISIPTDRRVAVLAGKGEGKTVLLQLLARTEPPDFGQVVTHSRLSPVVNSDRMFHRDLSGLENIRFYARRFGFDEERVILAMDSLYSIGPFLNIRIGNLSQRERRSMEATLTAALAFDCYMIDDVGLLASSLAERFLETAVQRGAGLIFATGSLRLARQFGDCAIVIQGQTLHPFSRIEEAARFYERG